MNSIIIIKLIKYLRAYLNYTVSSNIPVRDVVSSILVLSQTFLVLTDNNGRREEESQPRRVWQYTYMNNNKEEECLHLAISVMKSC